MADKRNIFEDVSDSEKPLEKPQAGAIDRSKNDARKGLRLWLMTLLGLVVLIIVIGGLTRLTDSGLSITDWRPIAGAIPPMNPVDWQIVFEKYKLSPEYVLQNKGMSLADFKSIYWWEWGHRQLGRLIGLVWALGFFWFLLRRQIPTGWTARLVGLGALGGLQGAIGWWMVSSGLSGRVVDVASYRLAIHLGLAFVIMGFIIWYMQSLGRGAQDMLQARRNREAALARLATILVVLIFAQILLGALVAGIDAGRGYTDWPMMGGQVLPSESLDYTPWWTNFFENPALVQFNHRLLGYVVFLFAGFAWWQSRRSPLRATKQAFNWMMAIVLLQMILGISTVLNAAQVHVAITHQIGAILLMTFVLRARFAAMFPATQSLR
ncbi:MAG: cytochrome c oxidase assembly protein subunit 15 [Paracoccaceae bacterium]|jgi:cytochrome c oxidase assembly protein subunit 15